MAATEATLLAVGSWQVQVTLVATSHSLVLDPAGASVRVWPRGLLSPRVTKSEYRVECLFACDDRISCRSILAQNAA